jgi:hypothetical protein
VDLAGAQHASHHDAHGVPTLANRVVYAALKLYANDASA